jgi:uncharacterized protein
MLKMSRNLHPFAKIFVALLWLAATAFFCYMARAQLLITGLALLPDGLATIGIAVVSHTGFLILLGMIVGLSSLLLWSRRSATWATTLLALLIPFLLFCGGILYASIDTQGVQRYVIAAAQRGDLRGTREQLLIQSGLNGTLDLTQQLIQRGTDVNARDAAGHSALYWASSGRDGNAAHVKLLLQAGAQPDGPALSHAATWGQLETIKLMLAATADDGKALVAASGNEALDASRTHTRVSDADRAEIAKLLTARGAKAKAS